MPERTASAATKADTLLLVGCGQMGSAMLRGWMVRDAAARFIAIEPAGLPSSFADAKNIAWHAAAEELPDDLTPDAVVFAVKPQIINDVLPAYRRWVQPQTLFLSIAAGITISGIARHLGEAAIIRTMPNTPAAIGRGITAACANPLVTPEQSGRGRLPKGRSQPPGGNGNGPPHPASAAQTELDDRDRIIDAALACISRRGWRRLSLAEIAGGAGVPILRVYRMYHSKAAVLC